MGSNEPGGPSRRPPVTVVVAVYNGEPYLAEALESALDQDYPSIEIVVIDDGSTDRTAEIARCYPTVRYHHQPNRGLATARNHGIELATGELVTFLDADDVLLPERSSAQADFLASHPEMGCVLARHEILLAPGRTQPTWLVRDAVFGDLGGVEPGSAMLPTHLARQIQFDPSYPMVDGMEWLTDAGVTVGVCDRVLWRRRIHEGNHSRDRQGLRDEMLRMVRLRVARSTADSPDAGGAPRSSP